MEYTTDKGIDVLINPAKFVLADKLRKQVVKELKCVEIDLGDLNNLKEVKGEVISKLIQSLLALDSSDDLQKALFNCLDNCTYDKMRINQETFEDMDARGEYYRIMAECLKVNLSPFFKNLVSQFSELTKKISNIQNPTSPQTSAT